MKNIKNTKKNLNTIDTLATWFITNLKLDANNILNIKKGAREILKCTADHKPEDRDFDNFATDMCYVGANWLNYTDDDMIKDGEDTWRKLYNSYMTCFFNEIEM